MVKNTLKVYKQSFENVIQNRCLGVLKSFANFTWKHLWWGLFNKEAFRPATLLKRDSNTGVFLWNLLNFYRKPFPPPVTASEYVIFIWSLKMKFVLHLYSKTVAFLPKIVYYLMHLPAISEIDNNCVNLFYLRVDGGRKHSTKNEVFH